MPVATPTDTCLDRDPLAGDPVFDLQVDGKIELRTTVGLADRDALSMACVARA